ncbi:MAG: helix-turn-helix transcriptional regulator [Cellulomonas sp.]|nr:helix-turn-helix transcriptional regulator [Cellulomonas sp.]
MERALGVAVVATAPVVRQGLALQLRLRGVAVPAEAANLRELDPQTPVRGLVLVADPRHDPQALSALLIRGTSVVALHEGVRPALPGRAGAPAAGRPDAPGWSRPPAVPVSPARRPSALRDRPAGAAATAAASVGSPLAQLRRTSRRGRLVVLDLAGLADVDVVLEHLTQLCESPSRRSSTHTPLTPTERSVHALLGQGYSNVGIAEILGLSPKTVEGCVSAVFAKLGLQRDDPARNRRVAAALRWFAAAN